MKNSEKNHTYFVRDEGNDGIYALVNATDPEDAKWRYLHFFGHGGKGPSKYQLRQWMSTMLVREVTFVDGQPFDDEVEPTKPFDVAYPEPKGVQENPRVVRKIRLPRYDIPKDVHVRFCHYILRSMNAIRTDNKLNFTVKLIEPTVLEFTGSASAWMKVKFLPAATLRETALTSSPERMGKSTIAYREVKFQTIRDCMQMEFETTASHPTVVEV